MPNLDDTDCDICSEKDQVGSRKIKQIGELCGIFMHVQACHCRSSIHH